MPARNPDERPEIEGLPDEVEDHPPGKGIELDEESRMLPRDYSIAAGSDPAYPVTVDEQRRPETPADRHAREEPEVGLDPGGAPAEEEPRALHLLTEDPDADGEMLAADAPGAAPSAAPEETALHEEEEGL